MGFGSLGALALLAVGAGVYDAMSSGEGGSPAVIRLLSEDAGAVVTGPAGETLGQIEPGDPALKFPAALANLPFSPAHLAVDQATGDVWFMEFTYGEKNILHRYSERNDKLESFPVPASKGSELYSAIAVDARGHVISAEGFVVLDFDPATASYKEYSLSTESPYETNIIGEGQFIADMAPGDDGRVYVSRLDVAAITELDLGSGNIREVAFPRDFGQADDIEVNGDTLWMANTSDIESGPSAQIGRLDLATGEFALVPGKTTALASGAGLVYAVTWAPGAALAVAGDSGLSVVEGFATDESFSSSLSGPVGHIAVDPRSGAVWATAEYAGSIVRAAPSHGTLRTYRLPGYETMVFAHCPQGLATSCPASTEVKTRVRGLAAGPGGDLWFSDGTRNRIGVIRADQ